MSSGVCVRVWENPEFDPETSEGQDAIASCDFVVSVAGIEGFYPGHFHELGFPEAIKVVLNQTGISRPIGCRRYFEQEIEFPKTLVFLVCVYDGDSGGGGLCVSYLGSSEG